MNSQTCLINQEQSFTEKMGECFSLTKPHLSISIGFSAFFGSSLAVNTFTRDNIYIGLAIFILACGCSCLNNIQDRHLDTYFLRTKARALPQKRISLKFASILSSICIIIPITLLFLYSPHLEAGVSAIISVFFYNALYTPLKKNFVMAILPGIICGMLPVLIGYAAIGGTGLPAHLIIACIILMAWQIPHTWLIILHYFPDYEKNKLPSFLDLFGPQTIKRLICIWVFALSVMMIFFAASLGITDASWLIVINAFVMALSFALSLLSEKNKKIHYRSLFIHLNISLFIMMTISMLDKV